MQTPKPTRPGSLEVPKKSPTSIPKTARKLKTAESDLVSSPNTKIRTPKTQSPKVVVDRRSPRTPVNEKKKTVVRSPDVSSTISHLQEELKKAKEQLTTSEALKKEAQDEAEETKQHLIEINSSEDSRIDELRKLSQERDKAWQSELEAMQRQHAMDSAALSSAMNEVQKLKAQLSDFEEMQSLVEQLKGELFDAKEGEARAHEFVSGTEKQLEIANLTLEMLRSDGMKMSEACNSLTTELEQSKSEVKSLEQLVRQLEKDEDSSSVEELNVAREEIIKLKSAVEVTERRYHEEYVQSTLQIRTAYEQVEVVKAELGEELKRVKDERDGLHEKMEREKNEALEKLAGLSEEVEKSGKRAENATEQLGAVQVTNTELEAELRRLKVQCDQWRKAAEAAAGMLSGNGKYVERTGSLESPLRRNNVNNMMMSPYMMDETDDELSSPKKKSMLKKIGVLLKKGQK